MPLTTTEHHSGSVDRIAIHRLLNPASNENADTSRAQVARLPLELAHTGNAPFRAHASLESTEDVVVHEEILSGDDSNHRASLAQAKRLGTVNGLKLVGKGYPLPTDDYLRGWYKVHYPMATDAQVDAYVRAYMSAYAESDGTPEKQAECLGRANGLSAAWNGYTSQSRAYLRGWYKVNYPTATDAQVDAYVRAYESAYTENDPGATDAQCDVYGEHDGTPDEQAEVFDGVYDASPSIIAHESEGDDTAEETESAAEVQEPSSFTALVSVHLSGLSNGLTPETREGLLALTRSESALIEERVAAAVLLYLNDEGSFKAEAEKVLKGFVSNGNLLCSEDIVEYVRSVLWNYEGLADELVAGLPRVLAELNAGMSRADDVILYEGKPSSAVDTRQSQPESRRKRTVDQVFEESDSNKEQRVVEGDVSVRGDHHDSLHIHIWTPPADAKCLEHFHGIKDDRHESTRTPIEQAKHLGRLNGKCAARQGYTLKSLDDLKTSYRKNHPEATDDTAVVYAKNYLQAYEAGKGTSLDQAKRLGRKNGTGAATDKFVLKSPEDLKTWYKKSTAMEPTRMQLPMPRSM